MELADALLASPVGVSVLAALEATQRDDTFWFDVPEDVSDEAVAAAVTHVGTLELGPFLALAVDAGERYAGPWSGRAHECLPLSYAGAPARAPIAHAIAARFGDALHTPFAPGAQQWWWSEGPPVEAHFGDLTNVYGNGEFPWNGLWTVTDPPPEAHDALAGAWEIDMGPITRWRLPVRPDARVWTIDRPADWGALVERFPKVATREHAGWELPGINQHPGELQRLLAQPGQHAARTSISRHVLPDWERVRDEYDGVHLSWAGYLTTEGYVHELADGSVTMLRYWFSERTLWLRDVFEVPTPLDPEDERHFGPILHVLLGR